MSEGAEGSEGASASARPRQLLAVVVILAVTAIAVTVAFSRQHGSAAGGDGGNETGPSGAVSSSATPTTDAGSRDAHAIAVLSQQDRALSRGSAAGYAKTWDVRPASQHLASRTFANLRALRVRHLNARYVAADPAGLTADQQRRLGGDAWTASVDISWRLADVDRTDATATLTYTFVEHGGQVRVARITPSAAEREPVWLLGGLHVRRSARTVVAATTRHGAERLDTALRRAVHDVGRVVPSWHGDLVAYVPSTTHQLEALLDSAPGAYDGIAAVTTTVDGSRDPESPVAIVINPTVFDRLGPIGSHVVVTHESTHVATGATTVTMPLWVAEGFADYVGVGSVDVPLSVSARAAVHDVRRHGPPRTLPRDGAFHGRGTAIEVAYEQAWLAMRVIARDHGQRRLVAFYQDVVHHPDTLATSLRDNLGTTRAGLTNAWRSYLEELADEG